MEGVEDLIASMRALKDPAMADEMSAYMRRRFEFLGLQKPRRAAASRDWLAAQARSALSAPETLAAMAVLYSQPEREFHYVAIDLFARRRRAFARSDIDEVLPFIDVNAWWDSVDALRKPLAEWAWEDERLRPLGSELLAGSMWRRRTAVTLQLGRREATDTTFLDRAIAQNVDDGEFFIQKAIGWALRDYSRTDPRWVEAAAARHRLDGLALREATKHLP